MRLKSRPVRGRTFATKRFAVIRKPNNPAKRAMGSFQQGADRFHNWREICSPGGLLIRAAMNRLLIRQSPTLAFIESLALLFAITWLDLATGHQVSLVLFYTVPIIFTVWLCDNKTAFGIAGLAGVLWSWADLALGHSYSNETVQAWEIAVRFAFFLLVAFAGISMRERQCASRARISLLEHTQRLEKQI